MVGSHAAQSARYCGRLLAMPNTTPPVVAPSDAVRYGQSIKSAVPEGLDVLLAVKLVPSTGPSIVRACAAVPGVAAFKLYPAGVTTHSADGIPAEVIDSPNLHPWLCDVLAAMQECDLVLCLHGEHPDEDNPFEREPLFHPFVRWVLATYPRLRVVMEHITRARSVEFVYRYADTGRLGATITAHHLMLHFGHLCGTAASSRERRIRCGDGKLHTHNFCMPVVGLPSDREALVLAATSGHPSFFLGSDSAPHPVSDKEAACGCAGIYSAPVLPEVLTQTFADRDAIVSLPAFVAGNGDRFYRRPPADGHPVVVRRRKWTVPDRVNGFEPFLAGCTLDWQMEPN